jgi:hypothetical protein
LIQVRGSAILNNLLLTQTIKFAHAKIGGSLELRGSDQVKPTVAVLGAEFRLSSTTKNHLTPVDFTSLTLGGDVDMAHFMGPGVTFKGATIGGVVNLSDAKLLPSSQDGNIFSARFTNAKLSGLKASRLTAYAGLSFVGATVVGDVQLANAELTPSYWSPEDFYSALLASGTRFGLDLLIQNVKLLPNSHIKKCDEFDEFRLEGAEIARNFELTFAGAVP